MPTQLLIMKQYTAGQTGRLSRRPSIQSTGEEKEAVLSTLCNQAVDEVISASGNGRHYLERRMPERPVRASEQTTNIANCSKSI